MSKNDKANNSRRSFLRKGLLIGGAVGGAMGLSAAISSPSANDGDEETVRLLTPDGKLVEVKKSELKIPVNLDPARGAAARKGIPGRKFVMVIDLAKCQNARKCITACQRGHDLSPDQEWIKVHLMQDQKERNPYWFPKPCYHCDSPSCVKVCPVGATFKRDDGCVLIDADRCIGCKFCISACPYSVRIFNWKDKESYSNRNPEYSPETGVPGQVGVASKCDFCPDRSRNGQLPHCAEGCPMGVIYFGDANEDTVTNGEETLRFRQTIAIRAGYRYLEGLGTNPNVYYLPASHDPDDFKAGLEGLTEEEKARYNNILKPDSKNGKQ